MFLGEKKMPFVMMVKVVNDNGPVLHLREKAFIVHEPDFLFQLFNPFGADSRLDIFISFVVYVLKHGT